MSARKRLSKLFHKADEQPKTPESKHAPPPVASTSPTLGHKLRKSASIQSLRDKVSGRSRNKSVSAKDAPQHERQPEPEPGAVAAAQKAAAIHGSDQPTDVAPDQLSNDMQNLNVDDGPYSEKVADRNLAARQSYEDSDSLDATTPYAEQTPGLQQPTRGALDSRSPSHIASVPAPLIIQKRPSEDLQAEDMAPVVPSKSPQRQVTPPQDTPPQVPPHQRIPRASLDKPLPDAPTNGTISDNIDAKHDSAVESALGREKGYLVRDAKEAPDLTGIVDLSNTEDTTVHERWAPAVTHETIRRDVHHIREERITREIHNYHVYHRILPVIDIEVLPARHFVPMEGGYAEISEDEIPARAREKAQWAVAEFVSKLLPGNSGAHVGPRQFTARKFEDGEGDYKEYTAPEGHLRTETTWVHPPTMEDGGRRTGQTYPFHFGSENPAENGLRVGLPTGRVIGVSPLLAKQQREGLQRAPYTRTESSPMLPRPDLPSPSLDLDYGADGRKMRSEAFV